MTVRIIVFLTLGILIGRFSPDLQYINYSDRIVNIGLYVLLFFVGIDIGKSKRVFYKISKIGWKILFLPMSVAVGSILGSVLFGIFINMPFNEAGAVGAGFGWYTLSSIIISDIYSTQLGTIAFVANVFREVIAILLIPIICKKIGEFECISIAGATAMDTTLPIITQNTGAEYAIFAFVTGALLSLIMPVVVSVII